MQAPFPLVPALKSNWLMMHVKVMLLSYTSLIVGLLLGIFLLILTNGKREDVVLQGNSYGTTFNKSNLLDIAYYKEGPTDDYSNLLTEELESSVSIKKNRLSLI